ncbi:MAG TPA: diacylglycerol kinase family protein [Vicinamibacteria bacterium]|nr:diacylglycerol kinase family protein [Vicinamibacteria bacterium]
MRVRAILNPRAGVDAGRALETLRRGRPSWPDLTVRLTEGPRNARELAREAVAEGTDLLLVAGGDGTVNEAAQGMIGSETMLGVVPVGSGNGLARSLGIPLQPGAALSALETGVPRRMDVGLVNGEPFLNVAGAGFDAAVGKAFHHNGKDGGRRGIMTYLRLGLAGAFSYPAAHVTLEAGGERIEARILVVAFANGAQYGAGAVIAPRARLDDGRLEVVLVEEASPLELVLNTPRLFLGTIEGFSRYRRVTCASALLTAAAPIEHHRDGEPEPEAARLEVGLLPRALRVLVPRATAEDAKGPFTG